jgi:predicted cupin superfamily sugar epimerase
MRQPTVEELIKALALESLHEEGGYYRETYRASEKIIQSALPSRFSADRVHGTAIYYLLPQGTVSKLHRFKSDEIWHYYLGGPFCLLGIDGRGEPYEVTIGPDVLGGQHLQYTVPAGDWFGGYCKAGDYSLMGCTVAPGFEFADFEIGDQTSLLPRFPKASEVIRRLCEP